MRFWPAHTLRSAHPWHAAPLTYITNHCDRRPGLIREFLAEGLLISVSGALVGLGIAWLGVRLLLWAGSETIPRAAEVAMDWRVLTFTGLVLISTAVAFGLAPLAQVATRKTHDILKASGGRTPATTQAAALRRTLVIAELSLGLVLLVSCGLMHQAFWRLQRLTRASIWRTASR
jgi:hypothetical protein